MSIRSFFNVQSYPKLLSVLLVVTLILISCGSKQRRDFRLTFVFSGKLGVTKTDKLPQDIIDLSLPLVNCDKFVLVPKPTLYRLGFDKSTAKTLETNIKGGFAGNKNNPRLIRREIENSLSAKVIGEVFVQPNPYVDMKRILDSYLPSIGRNALKIFYVDAGAQEDTYDGVRIYSTIDDIRTAISNKLCEKGLSSVFVFINPPLAPSIDVFAPVRIQNEIETKTVLKLPLRKDMATKTKNMATKN